MRDDKAYFLDMLFAARKIQKFTSEITEAEFRESELHQSAVIRELQVIGEAARSISEDTKLAHPEVEWEQIAGMRNYIIHEYFRVKLHIVWDTVQNDIAGLIAQLEPLIPPEAE
jgi:uncharacterized protein with HEPN domain